MAPVDEQPDSEGEPEPSGVTTTIAEVEAEEPVRLLVRLELERLRRGRDQVGEPAIERVDDATSRIHRLAFTANIARSCAP